MSKKLEGLKAYEVRRLLLEKYAEGLKNGARIASEVLNGLPLWRRLLLAFRAKL